jgi:hypothetical protein
MSHTWKKRFMPLLAAAIGLACALPSLGAQTGGADNTAAQNEPASEAQGVGGGTVLFADDFSDTSGGWFLRDNEGLKLEYASGEFRVFVDNDQSSYVYPSSYIEADWADARFSVDARRVSGDDSASIYLACRRVDSENFIAADIDFDGDARIATIIADEQTIVAEVEGVGALTGGSNHLELECAGDLIRFTVNGDLVLSAMVGGPAAGGIAIAAGGAGRGQSDFYFDNVLVVAP